MELIQGGGRNPHVVSTVRCAAPNCSAIKGEVNHWWMVNAIDDLFTCEPLGGKLWSIEENAKPVCGMACAQRLFEQFLRTNKL